MNFTTAAKMIEDTLESSKRQKTKFYNEIFYDYHDVDVERLDFDVVEAYEKGLYFVIATYEMCLWESPRQKDVAPTGEILMYVTVLSQVRYSEKKGVQLNEEPVDVAWNWSEQEALRYQKIFVKGLRRNTKIPTGYLNAFWLGNNVKEQE